MSYQLSIVIISLSYLKVHCKLYFLLWYLIYIFVTHICATLGSKGTVPKALMYVLPSFSSYVSLYVLHRL